MLNSILLQAEGAAWTNIVMIVALIAIFYLFTMWLLPAVYMVRFVL